MDNKLNAFLNPVYKEKTQQIIISERFKIDGEPVVITIKTITEETNTILRKQSMVTRKIKGQETQMLDPKLYSDKLILECVVDPNFSDSEFCRACGVVNPIDVLGSLFVICIVK